MASFGDPIRIFITGATGFIGGTILHTLAVKVHPEYQYTALVRTDQAARKIRERYHNVDVVLGDLDSLDILEVESSKANIVINAANNDHVPSIRPILRGLSTPLPGESGANLRPRFLIHTSGTSILLDQAFGRGTHTAHLYDDFARAHELVNELPNEAWHRDVDMLVLFSEAAPRGPNVHIAIVCPPCVYGRGSGTGKIVSWQIPQMIKHFINRKKGFTVNNGEAVWGNVHVEDLANIYALLVDRAAQGDENPEVWDREGGYYLAAAGEHHWGLTAQLVASLLYERGLLPTDELDRLTPEQIQQLGAKTGPLEWGCNSRGKARHAREILGWEPQRGSLQIQSPGAEVWNAQAPLGLGRPELEEEIELYHEGHVH